MKTKEKKKEPWACYTCGDCKNGTWVGSKNIYGQLFVKVCEHATWHEFNGNKLTLRGSIACEHLKLINNESKN